jgi:hypothetical protein
MTDSQWQVGDVVITKVLERESALPAGGPALANATLAEIRSIDWLSPRWLNVRQEFRTSVHSLLVQTPCKRIVIDTGNGIGIGIGNDIGNDKVRQIAS